MLAAIANACLTRGVEPGGAGFRASSKVIAEIQTAFAGGLVATVRPAADDPAANPLVVRGTWKEQGQTERNVKHLLSRVGNTWYWDGWIDVVLPR